MSIGVGVKCADGIILCADTQITWSGSHKSYDRKIHYAGRDSPRAWVAFTYAGNPELMKMFAERFSNIFQNPQFIASLHSTRQTLVDVLEEMSSLIANDSSGLFMLCGITLDGESPVLLKISGQIIRPVDLYDYVGVGDCSVVRYLSKVLFHTSAITLKAASMLATYLIMQAKAFIDECGGNTDIVHLLPDGRIRTYDQGVTISYEQRTGMVEWFLSRIISSMSNPEDTKTRLGDDIERFSRRLRDEIQ